MPSENPLQKRFSLQVSVRREVPQTVKDFVQDEPEDWTFAFPEVKPQVFFLVKARHNHPSNLCLHSTKCPFKKHLSRKSRNSVPSIFSN